MNIMGNLSEYTQTINIILCVLIIGYAVKSFVDLLPTRELATELKDYLNILDLVKNQKNELEEVELKKLYEEYEEYLLSRKQFKYLDENIKDYNKMLKSKDYQDVKSEYYFNEISLIDKNFNLHSLNQKGPTLVGLGVLGTFLGLFLSLSQIDFNSTTSQQLNIIDKIIPGMSLAFLTSLVGMGTSILYTRCQKNWIGKSVSEIGKIEYNLDVIFPATTTSDILMNIEGNIKKLSETLTRELGDSVATAIDKNKDALFGTFAKSMDRNMTNMSQDISKRVSSSLNQIFNQDLINTFKELQNSLTETKNGLEANNNIFEGVIKELPKVVNRFKTMNEVSSSIFENAQKSMQEYDRYMKGTENFLLSLNRMGDLQKEIEQSISVLTTTTSKNYTALEETTNKNCLALNTTTVNLIEQYKNINSTLKESLIDVFTKNENLLNMTNELLDKNSGNIVELDKTMESNIKLIVDGMEDRRKDFEAQHIKITKNQEKLESEIGKALNEYDTTVSNVTGQIKDIIINMKEMLTPKDE
ncbi:MotA/TolQ/ExbB proton channel family protein [Cetobacterium somerae]|uniref:MotA/TolQ/ExbB proton channel family protein n=1 Tax=Cetobacterium sp. NK01 TaxID=2993530 RepID=UPI002116194C|nr:MotA/TolQ/ExbB proton channel family protein [Cetobacterium sp. NK01]MCQ8213376.1 MotA/TolQ/ExbB proton channel family protein [Cetobacterium sp. NK01]